VSGPDALNKLLANAEKNVKRTSSDIVALKQQKAKLTDQQRERFRTLRDELNELIGD
jgi:ParB family chromosome partitioning protein